MTGEEDSDFEKHENIWEPEEYDTVHRNVMRIHHDLQIQLQTATERSHHGYPLAIHSVRSGRPGRPKYKISEAFLRFAYQSLSITSIAEFLGVHRNTVRLALLEYGLAQPLESPFVDAQLADGERILSYTRRLSTLSDEDLDEELKQVRQLDGFSNAGITMLRGILRSRGHRVQRERIRLSLMRIDPENRTFRSTPVRRRTYDVSGPNAVWHHDGQHGKCLRRFSSF